MTGDIEAQLRLEWESLGAVDLPALDVIIEHAAPESASHRAALAELAEVRLSCTRLRTQVQVTGIDDVLATSRWTVRHVIAHLASWAMRTRQELESLVEDQPALETIQFERDGGPRAWNQGEVDARNGRATSALFDELEAEIGRMVDVVVDAPEQRLRQVVELPRVSGDPPVPWRMPMVAIVIGCCWHVRYHIARLERR